MPIWESITRTPMRQDPQSEEEAWNPPRNTFRTSWRISDACPSRDTRVPPEDVPKPRNSDSLKVFCDNEGRWPEKSVKILLGLLDNLESNANVKIFLQRLKVLMLKNWSLDTCKLIKHRREEEELTERTENQPIPERHLSHWNLGCWEGRGRQKRSSKVWSCG